MGQSPRTPAQAGVASLLRALTLMSQKEGLTTINQVRVFLLIGRREADEGVLVRDLVKATAITQSAIARIVAALGDQPVRGMGTGLHWVTQTPDSEDPRRVRIKTTEAGRKVLSELETIMS